MKKAFKVGRNTWVPASAICMIKHHGMDGTKTNYNEWEIILFNATSFILPVINPITDKDNIEVVKELKEYYGIN